MRTILFVPRNMHVEKKDIVLSYAYLNWKMLKVENAIHVIQSQCKILALK